MYKNVKMSFLLVKPEDGFKGFVSDRPAAIACVTEGWRSFETPSYVEVTYTIGKRQALLYRCITVWNTDLYINTVILL